MKTGTLVRLKMFTLKADRDVPEDVYRYGLALPQPLGFGSDFTEVMWQPTSKLAFGKGRNQREIIVTDRLEVVSEGAPVE